jgi:DNA-binding LacI/PurR family transcriptional regulator
MNRKRVSIKDVAQSAGVSYQTVSKVLNGHFHASPETMERIRQAVQTLGYKPHVNARNLRTQRSRMLGYSWVPVQPDQANHILDLFLTSMVEEAEAAGYHLLPFPYREGDEQVSGYRELIETGRVDGFVVTSIEYGDPRIHFLLEQGFPFVGFGRSGPNLDHPYVDVDNTAGMRLATEHLIAQGHHRIAVLAWPENSRVGNERLEGYLGGLRGAGLAPDPELIVRGTNSFEFGRSTAEAWLALPPERRPTAIVALQDLMAIGAMHALQARGLVPGLDLALIGFDDVPMAQYLWPPLSSVRQPIREAGRKCVEMLVALIENKTLAERHVIVPPRLIVRATG